MSGSSDAELTRAALELVRKAGRTGISSRLIANRLRLDNLSVIRSSFLINSDADAEWLARVTQCLEDQTGDSGFASFSKGVEAVRRRRIRNLDPEEEDDAPPEELLRLLGARSGTPRLVPEAPPPRSELLLPLRKRRVQGKGWLYFSSSLPLHRPCFLCAEVPELPTWSLVGGGYEAPRAAATTREVLPMIMCERCFRFNILKQAKTDIVQVGMAVLPEIAKESSHASTCPLSLRGALAFFDRRETQTFTFSELCRTSPFSEMSSAELGAMLRELVLTRAHLGCALRVHETTGRFRLGFGSRRAIGPRERLSIRLCGKQDSLSDLIECREGTRFEIVAPLSLRLVRRLSDFRGLREHLAREAGPRLPELPPSGTSGYVMTRFNETFWEVRLRCLEKFLWHALVSASVGALPCASLEAFFRPQLRLALASVSLPEHRGVAERDPSKWSKTMEAFTAELGQGFKTRWVSESSAAESARRALEVLQEHHRESPEDDVPEAAPRALPDGRSWREFGEARVREEQETIERLEKLRDWLIC